VDNQRVWFSTAVAVLCFCGSAWGQASEADSVKGELHLDSLTVIRSEVTLTDLRGGRTVGEEYVGTDGRFEFRHVPLGEYRLMVLDEANRPIHEELLTVREQAPPIQVVVKLPENERPAGATVSAQDLLHPPTPKAFKAFVAAQKFSAAGAHEKAVEQLEKAVRLSPEYGAAWVNLAAEHILLKRYEEALQELTHASEISKPTAMLYGDMAFAQYCLRRFADGTRSAREALRLDPSSAPAHYLLGTFLVLDRRTQAEGFQHLEQAARTMPAAQAELERVRHESAQVVTRH
jgi:tetratricopeptide (TPR) repeat protein